MEKKRVLVIGGTGHIGKHIVAAGARLGHPTVVLVREFEQYDPVKAQLLNSWVNSGLLKGDLHDYESLVKAIKCADVVISAVGPRQVAEQTRIIAAIKEAGNVKRFVPSEFGSDVDRLHTMDPAASLFSVKAKFWRLIEVEEILHTFVSFNSFPQTYSQASAMSQPSVLALRSARSPSQEMAMPKLCSWWKMISPPIR
ncbi:unnamed protein product [Urochloa humidicola]